MAFEFTQTTSQLVLPASAAPFGNGADCCGFGLIHATDIASLCSIYEWVDVFRQNVRRSTSSPGSPNNNFNMGKRGSDGSNDGVANATLVDGNGFTPLNEKIAFGFSYVASTGILTAMAKSETVSLATGVNNASWTSETGTEVLTIGDIGDGFDAFIGLCYFLGIRNHIMTTAEFEEIFASKFLHEFVRKNNSGTGGNFNGPAGMRFMVGHALHPNNSIDGAAATTNFMFYNFSSHGALYADGKYDAGSGIESFVTLSTASDVTYRRHAADPWFNIKAVGSSVSSTPVAFPNNAVYDLAHRNPRKVRRVGESANSRGISGSGRNYGDGLIGDPELKPHIIGVSNIAITTSGINIGTFVTGTPWTTGSPEVLHNMTVDGQKQDLGRWLWNSTSGSSPTGNGTWLNEGDAISIKVTHAAGTGFNANTQPIKVTAYALAFPDGGRLQVNAVTASAQNQEGSSVADLGSLDCSTELVFGAQWESATMSYTAGTKTIVIQGTDLVAAGVTTSHAVVLTDDPYSTVRAAAAINSISVNGGDTTIVLKRALGNAPAEGNLLKFGDIALVSASYDFTGSEGANFRGLRLECEEGFGPCIAAFLDFYRTDVSEGFIIQTYGCSGAGYDVQQAAFADTSNILALKVNKPDIWIVFPAQQSSTADSIGEISDIIRAHNPDVTLIWCTDPQHGNWEAENHESWWQFMAENHADWNACYVNPCNDERIGDFLEQYADGRRADTAHLTNRGNIFVATAMLDDLKTVAQEVAGGSGGNPKRRSMSGAVKVALGLIN